MDRSVGQPLGNKKQYGKKQVPTVQLENIQQRRTSGFATRGIRNVLRTNQNFSVLEVFRVLPNGGGGLSTALSTSSCTIAKSALL